jgi:hypothetical protein
MICPGVEVQVRMRRIIIGEFLKTGFYHGDTENTEFGRKKSAHKKQPK